MRERNKKAMFVNFFQYTKDYFYGTIINKFYKIRHVPILHRHARRKKMSTVFDTAKYILKKQGALSTWKLQKLCYYAQAWHYTWTDKPLFNERIEAWANGPVCSDLFNAHRGLYVVNENDIPFGNADNLTKDEKNAIDTVLSYYGNWQPYELREQTHLEKPWIKARKGVPEGARSDNPISLESMGKYYGSL